MKDENFKVDLYLKRFYLSKEIPKDNYQSNLPVISHLRKMGGIQLSKPVTFLLEKIVLVNQL